MHPMHACTCASPHVCGTRTARPHRWLNYRKSCEQRRGEARRRSYMGLERWMDDEMCDGLIYGTVRRHASPHVYGMCMLVCMACASSCASSRAWGVYGMYAGAARPDGPAHLEYALRVVDGLEGTTDGAITLIH